MTTQYLSLVEEAELELEASKQRLERSQRALRDFHAEHSALVGDGRLCYIVSSPDVRVSLDAERMVLELEQDEAMRQFAKSLQDWSGLKK